MSSKKNKSNHHSDNSVLLTSSEPVKFTEYRVVVGNSPEELSDLVNKHIKEGWTISGGVAMCIETSPYHSKILLSQALTK